MPRPRKYDPSYDMPVTIFVKVPIYLINDLEKIGINKGDLEKKIKEEKIVENFIIDLIENNKN